MKPTTEELNKFMNEHRLGYGLLREYITRGNPTQALRQVTEDIEDCYKKIYALEQLQDMLRRS